MGQLPRNRKRSQSCTHASVEDPHEGHHHTSQLLLFSTWQRLSWKTLVFSMFLLVTGFADFGGKVKVDGNFNPQLVFQDFLWRSREFVVFIFDPHSQTLTWTLKCRVWKRNFLSKMGEGWSAWLYDHKKLVLSFSSTTFVKYVRFWQEGRVAEQGKKSGNHPKSIHGNLRVTPQKKAGPGPLRIPKHEAIFLLK